MSDSSASAPDSEDLGAALVQALNDEGFTKLGSEAVNGEPCDVFGKTEDGATAKIWVSTKDQFPRKVEAGDGETQVVLVVSDVNKPIVIKAPI